jgi:ribonuclease HII
VRLIYFSILLSRKSDNIFLMNTPSDIYERKIWRGGFRVVAGADEVGRGCFAGPVVASMVAFRPGAKFRFSDLRIKINDSKKLTAKRREETAFWIKKNALCYGIGSATVAQINRFGIKKSSEIAFRRAIKNSQKRIDYLLVDAFYVPFIKGLRRKNQLAIIKGDEKSYSIAAASIIAKVYRDRLMEKLGTKLRYKKYFWFKNKGYGTKDHRYAILRYGVTNYHRRDFTSTFLAKLSAKNLSNSSFSPVQ